MSQATWITSRRCSHICNVSSHGKALWQLRSATRSALTRMLTKRPMKNHSSYLSLSWDRNSRRGCHLWRNWIMLRHAAQIIWLKPSQMAKNKNRGCLTKRGLTEWISRQLEISWSKPWALGWRKRTQRVYEARWKTFKETESSLTL